MTIEEVDLFRMQFKSIVYQKSCIQATKQYIRELSRYDKHGSHGAAINRGIDRLAGQRALMDKMLGGKTYDDWKAASAKISGYHSRMKRGEAAKRRATIELENFNFVVVSRETVSAKIT